jgi:hypothetical protein
MNRTQTLAMLEEQGLGELGKAVIRQFGGFNSFKECAEDVTNHGINAGFHGFIYYTDTCKFAKRNRNAIRRLAEEQARDFGESPLTMIANFSCLRDSELSEMEIAAVLLGTTSNDQAIDAQIFNALAWYAAEEVCRAYVDATEQE